MPWEPSGSPATAWGVETFVEPPGCYIVCILGILGAVVILTCRQIGQGRRHALS